MYEKWTDEELRKEQKQIWINLAIREACIIALFAVTLLVYLAARNGMWWVICGGGVFLAVCVFTYSLCFVAARADDIQGTR